MIRTLHLTSPLMVGNDVLSAQKRLTSSRFGNFHPGPVDGAFGEKSAAATRRAKYWLGYPTDQINLSYGATLHAYLGGKTLPALYQFRRKRRLAAHADKPLREKAFAVAVANLGETEHPAGSNQSKFTDWYGFAGPWCAMFVTFCYVVAGSKKTFVKGSRYAFTPFMTRDARAGVNAMRVLPAAEVRRGDVVMFDWGGDGRSDNVMLTDHTGLFDRWVDGVGGSFHTIEGNTAVGNDSNGGIVMRRVRSVPFVEAFIRCEV